MNEQLILLWRRPDGEEAVKIVFPYPLAAEAAKAVEECLKALFRLRCLAMQGKPA